MNRKFMLKIIVRLFQNLVNFFVFKIGGGQVVITADRRNAQLFEHVKPLIAASVTSLPNAFDSDYIPGL